ncbi:hypothetical protein N136_01988 [Leifsonia aquatica ATCC 14665]|uniref:Uncharacterized protein n=1 Tax=Leifsonia aquatica ATCC 14665 TaxID=1358026 RepID=U2R8T2_LEIAQ|nr:hypothetical protein N136_01988 [Leifsonia aquatica ATCC 14665]
MRPQPPAPGRYHQPSQRKLPLRSVGECPHVERDELNGNG